MPYIKVIMIFDRYLFKMLAIATVFISLTLASVIFLTQSLRFLELVINSGASGAAFLLLTLLALPRFFEIILPIALMAGVVFVYNRMTMDSEVVAMKACGASPWRLARPALTLSAIVMVLLFAMTAWLGPVTLANMQHLRQVIKAQYSNMLFREGVFNPLGAGLTVFVRARSGEGEMQGIVIHDSRAETASPVTIIAKRGILVSTQDSQQVVVYDGSRQAYDAGTGHLTRLDFSRYTIDLPEENAVVRQRWREPSERTLWELFTPDSANQRDLASRRAFLIEIHRRLVSPFLAPAFAAIALAVLLLGPLERRGMGRRIAAAILVVIVIEGLYLAAFSLSERTAWGVVLMYALVFGPLATGLFFLRGGGEGLRHKFGRLLQRRAAT